MNNANPEPPPARAPLPGPRTVDIVPHTHWDREWYRPFQSFRMQLVDLLDGLLPELEANPAYAHFMLDGQMAVIDDYLAVRPEQRPVIRRLAASGRLSVGPWFILMDEFLVSGETMVRNLRLGLDRASEYGGGMPVGYLPDMFGHVAQMPQLLAQFGFEHAVVWRGVPSVLGAEAFHWGAPDGSTVRAEYLPQGYSNGAVLPDDAKELVARIDQFCSDEGGLVGDPVLWMNGTDHLLPQPWLGRVVAEANDLQDDYRLVVTSLADHVAAGRTEGLPVWRGELRSGARANLLMGVASNRTDIRQAAARTERAIEQVAEPLAALFLPADRWPSALLHEAWGFMIRNSAHDSICACSVDAVCDAVLHRYAEAGQIAAGITDRALAAVLAAAGGAASAVVVNPSMRCRSGLIDVVVTGDEPLPGTQVLSVRPARSAPLQINRGSLEQIVVRAVDENPFVHDVSFDEGDDGDTGRLTVTLHADSGRAEQMRTGPLRARLAELAAIDPDGVAHIETLRRPTQRVLARVADLDGFSWRSWQPSELDCAPVTAMTGAGGATGFELSNGLVTVAVDADDGTFSVNGLHGLGRLVDDGDAGDTYNWSPPAEQVVIDRPESVAVEVSENGPLRARLVIDATYRWPERVEADRRVGDVAVAVRTTLELRTGEDVLRVGVELDNRSRDHRLRTWFPLPRPATASRAECAYAIVERGLTAEGGANEHGLPTFPSRRFVSAGGLTVVHDGLPEYELVDIDEDGDTGVPAARALALTLLRCTGVISRGPMTMRQLPAGPPTPAPGAQMPGPQRLEYALHVGDRDPYELVDDAFAPLIAVRPRGIATTTASDGPVASTALTIAGAEVSAVTRTSGNRLEVRVFNPTDEETTVVVDRSGWMVDLRGRASAPFEGSFPLRAGGIQTVVLDPG